MIKPRLHNKLQRIKSGDYQSTDFIIADAKDGDMAFGVSAPGPARGHAGNREFLTRKQYLANMTAIAKSGLIDILLTSASSSETLREQGLFSTTDVTPCIRFNDTTDIWSARGSAYRDSASRPFETVDVDTAAGLCQFGLYSVTFCNDLEADLRTLERYRAFRLRAREKGLIHILEVFNPNIDINLQGADLGDYINDMILKTLAGITKADAPLFLKMQFNGSRSMSDLAGYDPDNLVVGILGGSAGTTRDTLELALQAESAGARVALFGRKINLSPSPIALVQTMRDVIERKTTPGDGVKSFHEHLAEAGIEPTLPLKDDLQITETALKN